jgi:hypothetical protein
MGFVDMGLLSLGGWSGEHELDSENDCQHYDDLDVLHFCPLVSSLFARGGWQFWPPLALFPSITI